MNMPVWIKPALYGAVAGALVLWAIGFSWAGWVTQSTAQQQSSSASIAAVSTALTPYCVALSQSDPRVTDILAELKAVAGYNKRSVIEKAGWATPLGTDKPNNDLARACADALAAG
ncbi:hypothetical protein ACI0FM_01545 [Paenochrobactrum sp. BZR 588]|uniref:hypothetical protein n=1 Tax=unclassified Paenochrobactrum TaxID=2639760 RepID=UPI003852F4C7